MSKKVVIKLKELAEKKGVSLREIGRLSDIEPAIINKLANQKHQRVQLAHIERIAESLEVDDIRDIIDFAEDEKN
ncbi:MAG: helix-turn-helix transcriptional regulator [Streptococcaceae bacterium]|jgi:DNA-binding Xre family transcriptional regulator|nr:helix-turn-helix transcriptional regulator [Streptococcaceae bacterium]